MNDTQRAVIEQAWEERDSVVPDTKGEVRTPFVVLKGPFGSNHITCARPSSCLVSVTQATLSPSEEADAAIAFR